MGQIVTFWHADDPQNTEVFAADMPSVPKVGDAITIFAAGNFSELEWEVVSVAWGFGRQREGEEGRNFLGVDIVIRPIVHNG